METLKTIFNPTIITFIGALIAATGVFLAAREDSKIKLELQNKTEQISELNQELTKTVTGGNSFAYIQPFIDTKNNKLQLDLFMEGDYPLYDLKVDITDSNKMKAIMDNARKNGEKLTRYDLDKYVTQVNVGTLIPQNVIESFGLVDLNNETKELNYTIRITARNGNFYQPLKVKITEKGLDIDSKVYKNNEILKEF